MLESFFCPDTPRNSHPFLLRAFPSLPHSHSSLPHHQASARREHRLRECEDQTTEHCTERSVKVGRRRSPRQSCHSPLSVHMLRLPNSEHLDTPWGLLHLLSGVIHVLMVMLSSPVGSMTVHFPAYLPTSQDKPSGSDQILFARLLGSHMSPPRAKC